MIYKNVPIIPPPHLSYLSVAPCVVVGVGLVIISVTMINNSDVKHNGSRAPDQINAYDHTIPSTTLPSSPVA